LRQGVESAATDHGGWIGLKCGSELLKPVETGHAVVICEGDVVSGGPLNACVASGGGACVVLAEQDDGLGLLVEGDGVGEGRFAAVVNDDDFEAIAWIVELCECLQAAGQLPRAIVGGNNNRKGGKRHIYVGRSFERSLVFGRLELHFVIFPQCAFAR